MSWSISLHLKKRAIHEAPHYVDFFNLQQTILFDADTYLNTLLPINNLSPRSFLNVRDQVSYPYKPAGKIAALYILILTFLHSRLEDISLLTE
jgi:hypothetical protein